MTSWCPKWKFDICQITKLADKRPYHSKLSLFIVFLKNSWNLDSKSIKKVDADGRYYGLQLLEKSLQFSWYIYFGHLVAIFPQFWYAQSISGKITPRRLVSGISMNAFLMLKIASSFQAAANHSSGHQRPLFWLI